MRQENFRAATVALLFGVLVLPLFVALAAGGRIEGKVTDPKGATVAGAAVTVTDPVTNQVFTAVTDEQGRYKIGGLAEGTYAITISASGFSEFRRDEDLLRPRWQDPRSGSQARGVTSARRRRSPCRWPAGRSRSNPHFTGKGITTASDSVAPRCFGPHPKISDPSDRTSTE